MNVYRAIIGVLAAAVVVLGYKVNDLEVRHQNLERNVVIAVLSAEIANNKVGAIAPYFGEDQRKFVDEWIRGTSMPLAVFDDKILKAVRDEIDRRSMATDQREMAATLMKQRPRY